MPRGANPLELLNAEIVGCNRCERLRAHCAEVARVRRRAYADWEYWGRPVPSFGDPQARVLALGLAPGAHGSNRTGRPFTGDGSGDFLFPILHQAGFASQPTASSRDDGMKLTDLWITSVGRCAPPGNKPTPAELRNCAPWLERELSLLANLRVVVCLGRIAFDGLLAHVERTSGGSQALPRSRFAFAHGAEFALPGGLYAIASYHPSLQNTNTGKLTRPMLLAVFQRARELADAMPQQNATPAATTSTRGASMEIDRVSAHILRSVLGDEPAPQPVRRTSSGPADPDHWTQPVLLERAAYLRKLAAAGDGQASETLREYPQHRAMLSFRSRNGEVEVHEKWADLFYVMAGAATLVTGGRVCGARLIAPGETRGASIEGGAAQELRAGDLVHIPAGTPHQFLVSAEKTVTCFVMKIQEAG